MDAARAVPAPPAIVPWRDCAMRSRCCRARARCATAAWRDLAFALRVAPRAWDRLEHAEAHRRGAHAAAFEAAAREQATKLLLGALAAAGPDHHGEIAPCDVLVFGRALDPWRHHLLDDENATVLVHGIGTATQDGCTAVVIPVVEDAFQQVDVTARCDPMHEVTGTRLDSG